MLQSLLIVILYPLVISVIPEPAAFRWARAQVDGTPLHESAFEEVERRGRWFYLVGFAIVAVLLFVWARLYEFSWSELGLAVPSSRGYAAAAASSVFLIVGRITFLRVVPSIRRPSASRFSIGPAATRFRGLSSREKQMLVTHPLSRGPAAVWLLVFIAAGIVEEPWRAFCLLAAQKSGFAIPFAVLASSIAFVYAHLANTPSRIPGRVAEIAWEFILGVVLAALFLTFGTVLIPYFSALAFNIFNLYLIRRRFACPT